MLDIIKEQLHNQFQNQVSWEEGKDLPTAVVNASILKDLVQFLFDEESLQFRFLTDITAVHFPDRKDEELMVVYHLHQLVKNFRLRIKVYVPITAPNVGSVVDIFSGADWMERETFDFYGVNFEGHPNLVRILNADEMDYHPMRKEYPMEDPMRTDKDDEMFGRGSTY